MKNQTFLCALLFFASCTTLANATRPIRVLSENSDSKNASKFTIPFPFIIIGTPNPTTGFTFPFTIIPFPFVPAPPTTPKKPGPATPTTPSTGGGDSTSPVVNSGAGAADHDGKTDSWWYKVHANGDLETSDGFFDDPNVPDDVKQMVKDLSAALKKGGGGHS